MATPPNRMTTSPNLRLSSSASGALRPKSPRIRELKESVARAPKEALEFLRTSYRDMRNVMSDRRKKGPAQAGAARLDSGYPTHWMAEAHAAEILAREERCRGLSAWLFHRLRVGRNGKLTDMRFHWLVPEYGSDIDALAAHPDGKVFDAITGHKLFSRFDDHDRYCRVGRSHLQTLGDRASGAHRRKLLDFLYDMDNDAFAALAVADFIVDPKHMVCTYLTLAGHLQRLARDRSQKFHVLEKALKFAELASLAAVSCLETLHDTSLSMMERHDGADRSPDLPALCLRAAKYDTRKLPTLQPIKIAIDNELGKFLAQPIVFNYLDGEWSGVHHHRFSLLETVVSFGFFGIFLVPVNLLAMLWTSIFPEHHSLLAGRLQRLKPSFVSYCGVFLIPSVKFWSSEISSFGFTILLTFERLVPWTGCVEAGMPKLGMPPECRQTNSVTLHWLLVWCTGFLYAELVRAPRAQHACASCAEREIRRARALPSLPRRSAPLRHISMPRIHAHPCAHDGGVDGLGESGCAHRRPQPSPSPCRGASPLARTDPDVHAILPS